MSNKKVTEQNFNLNDELNISLELQAKIELDNKNLRLALSIAEEDAQIEKERSDLLIKQMDDLVDKLCLDVNAIQYAPLDCLLIKVLSCDCSKECKLNIINELKKRGKLDKNLNYE